MHFAAPAFLLLLLAVPLGVGLYVAAERRGRSAAAAFAAPALLPSVAPRRPGWRRHVPPLAYLVALAVLVVALARPQRTVAVPEERASVMLLTDGSTSMRVTDVRPSRLDAARAAAATFLRQVPKPVRVGAVTFARRVQAIRSPTRDRGAVRDALNALRPRGATAIGEGLAAAERLLDTDAKRLGKRPPQAIILLSDGENTAGQDPIPVARSLRRHHIRVYTVSVGTPAGVLVLPGRGGRVRRVPVPPSHATLQEVAQITRGRLFAAPDAGRLKTVYEQLGSQIGTRRAKRQVTAAFAAGGLLFLLAGGLASLRWFARLP